MVQVSFEKYATVSTNINVFAAVVIDSAITSQQFGTEVAGSGTIVFVTEVGYPFQLTLQNAGNPIDIAPNGMASTSLSVVDSSPATQTGGVTSQHWKIVVTPAAGTCVLDGIYSTASNRFQLGCTAAAIANGECPTLSNTGMCSEYSPSVGIMFQFYV